MGDFPGVVTSVARAMRAKLEASGVVSTMHRLYTDEQGGLYVGDGATLLKRLSRMVKLSEQARPPSTFGEIGVGNDTAVVQAALDWANLNGGTLRSDPGVQYVVGKLTIPTVTIIGDWNFLTNDPAVDINLDWTGSRTDARGASVYLNGRNWALTGMRFGNIGRSKFGELFVQSCQRDSYLSDLIGNNSQVYVGAMTSKASGQRITELNASCTFQDTSVNSSITGYSTFTLPTPIAAKYIRDDNTAKWAQLAELNTAGTAYIAVKGSRPYLVAGFGGLVNGSYTTVDIFNLPGPVGSTRTFLLYIGGGINIPAWSDNNAWVIDNIDCADKGTDVQISPLYGPILRNPLLQASGIGIGVPNYTIGAVIEKPYFENNGVDIAVARYIDGIVTAPVWTGEDRYWNLLGALAGTPHYDQRCSIVTGRPSSLFSDLRPEVNPSATARLISPGAVYNYERTATGVLNYTFQNDGRGLNRLAIATLINIISASATTPVTVTITLANATIEGVAQTIEGAQSWTGVVGGRSTLLLELVNANWRVTPLSRHDLALSIAQPPVRLGQLAVVGTNVYMATGADPFAWTLLNGGGAPAPTIPGRAGRALANEWRGPTYVQSTGNVAPVDGQLSSQWVDLGYQQTWDGIGVAVTTAQAGGSTSFKAALYADDGTGLPNWAAGPYPGSSVTVDLTAGTGSRLGLFASALSIPAGRWHLVPLYNVTTAPTTAPVVTCLATTGGSPNTGNGPANGQAFRGRTATGVTQLPTANVTTALSTVTSLPVLSLHAT